MPNGKLGMTGFPLEELETLTTLLIVLSLDKQ